MNNNKTILNSLMVGAVGIVYGDIGTSPLYALKSCFTMTNMPVNENKVLGLVSLFIWLLIVVVNIKYITIIMRCEQQGEGGSLVLSSLCGNMKIIWLKKLAFILGIVAMALFVGDAVITPAISVLSAIEGLKLIANISEREVIGAAVAILVFLFLL